MPPENNQTVVKIGKFQASKTIVKESWAVLKQDKEIMWFPVVSSISTLLAVVVMGLFYYFVVLGGSTGPESSQPINRLVSYVVLFIFYIVTFFIANFFQAGLLIVVQGRFSGQNLSFSDGINEAKKYISKIFLWSVISSTVGVILRIIADKFKFIGRIVASLFGAAWNILTFFSLPSLVIGNLSVKDSFKESASIIRKTWGETIIINFGVGLFIGLCTTLLYALLIGIAILSQSLYVSVFLAILFVISLIIVSVVSSTLNSIFKLALFNYARTGQVPQGFSSDILKGAVK